MAYELTHWSKPYLAHTGKSAAEYDTASETWTAYQGLVSSDETVEIRDNGREIGWRELKMLAEQETR